MGWRPLRQHSRWLFALAVVAAVAAVVLDRWSAPWWAALILALAVAVLAVVLERAKVVAKQKDEHTAAGLAFSGTADQDGRLEEVSEVPLERLGVHRHLVEVNYLRRDAEPELVELLAAGRPVLVLGPSMAGKTRMAAHVLRQHYPHHGILRPSPPAGLGGLMNAGAQPRDVVVWLDDLNRYLTDEGLRAEWIDRLVDAGNLVLATMRASEHAHHHGDEEVSSPHAAALERFEIVRLSEDDTEQQRLARQAGSRRLRQGIRAHGLGQYLGGGHLALQRFKDAQAPPPHGHPLGVAMVRAAADWRRVGLDTVTTDTLTALAPAYLPQRYRHAPGEQDADALAWASQLIKATVRLLEPTRRPGAFRAPDYLLDHLNGATGVAIPIPPDTWRTAVQHAPAGRRMTVASAAHRHGRYADAETLWRQVADDPSQPAGAPQAALNLGHLLVDHLDRPEEAQAPLRQAADSGHPDAAPKAAHNLGALWINHLDRPKEAEAPLRQAADSGHPDVAPQSAYALGSLLAKHLDRIEEALAPLRQAADSGHPDAAPRAALDLGSLLALDLDRPEEALAPLRQAADSGHPDAAPRAALNLGALLMDRLDRPEAAEALLREAADSGHPDAAPQAALNLGILLMHDLDRPEEAEAPLRQAADSGHPDAAPQAAVNLGALLMDRLGQSEAAEVLWRQAADSGHPDAAPAAARNLGSLLMNNLDRPEEAEAPLRQAAASAEPETAAAAALELSQLLMYRLGRCSDAEAPLRQAADSSDSNIFPQAALELGNLLFELRGPAAAEPFWRQAVASDHPTAASHAAHRLDTRFTRPCSCVSDENT